MAGLCEGGNEPPGSLKASKELPPQRPCSSIAVLKLEPLRRYRPNPDVPAPQFLDLSRFIVTVPNLCVPVPQSLALVPFVVTAPISMFQCSL
ncbi:hypothetical protein ANN_00344 [Periplaneta americana]|uniref:Uncharacterized protein n=1 Tax=Periplaneta americana TaxID=6978 RepID=A0ABQ8TTC1_PERAM|nr:hypothetical protein ANN_00344 [Periplaneta americana]